MLVKTGSGVRWKKCSPSYGENGQLVHWWVLFILPAIIHYRVLIYIFSCAMVFCFLILFALIWNCMRLMGTSTLQHPSYLDSSKPSHWTFWYQARNHSNMLESGNNWCKIWTTLFASRTDTTRRKKSNGKHEGLKSYLNNLKRE
jgi:hypothetical protein